MTIVDDDGSLTAEGDRPRGGEEARIRAQMRADLPSDTFTPQPWRYLWVLVHAAILYGGIAFMVVTRPPVWVCLPLSVLCGLSLVANGFLAHEVLHGAMGGPRWLRLLAGWVGFGPFVIPPVFWIRWHNVVHHGNTNNGDSDPDNFGTVRRYEKNPAMAKFTKLAPGSGTWYSYLFLFYSFTFHAQLVLWMQVKHRKDFKGLNRNLHIAQTFVLAGIWLAIAVASGWLAVFTVVIPLAVGNFIGQSYILTNHFLRPMAPTNNPIDNSMSLDEPEIADRYFFHFSHHVEHHYFPRMPSNKAPRVREWIEENLGDRYVCPSHPMAVKMLYRTPRIYKDADTLTDPFGEQEVSIAEVQREMAGSS